MRKTGGGFGFIILLVVLAVVLLLAVKAWQSVTPTASQITDPGSGLAVPDHGQTEASEEVRQSNLPDLNEMRQSTSDHADQVQEAMEQAD